MRFRMGWCKKPSVPGTTTLAGVAIASLLTVGFGRVPSLPDRTAVASHSTAEPDSVQPVSPVQFSLHLLVLDPSNQWATLQVRNTRDIPVSADVLVQDGYEYYPTTDTALFPAHWRWQDQFPRDTVIAMPTARDRAAGPWISGVPARLVLAPHAVQQFTVRINPPAHLPRGEYYARILALVRSRRPGHASDTRTQYAVPVTGTAPVVPRDSVRIYYRVGPQTMGVRVVHAEARLDTTGAGSGAGFRSYPIRLLVQLHLTGTAHFEGHWQASIKRADGSEESYTGGAGNTVVLQRDAILRILLQADDEAPGQDTMIVRFFPWQEEFPRSQRLPMAPVEVRVPVTIPTGTGSPSSVLRPESPMQVTARRPGYTGCRPLVSGPHHRG